MAGHRDWSYRRRILGAALLSACVYWLVPVPPPTASRLHAYDPSSETTGNDIAKRFRPAQLTRQTALAKGKFLIAGQNLRDPNFIQTVVLLLEYNEKGAMGVIVNRATQIKLSELLPKIKSLQDRGDLIFEGGPVERSEILMLVRATQEPEDSSRVLENVYLSASAELLKRLAAESLRGGESFRVYSGYAGWGAGQLDAEVEFGSWHILPATETAVFAKRPERLWQELLDRTQLRLAFVFELYGHVASFVPANPGRDARSAAKGGLRAAGSSKARPGIEPASPTTGHAELRPRSPGVAMSGTCAGNGRWYACCISGTVAPAAS